MTPALLEGSGDDAALRARHVGAIARGGATALVGMLITAGAQYLFNVLLARNFGASVLGVFTFSFGLVAVAATLGQAGFRETLVRYVASYRAEGRTGLLHGLLLVALGFGFLASTALAALLYLGAPLLAAVSEKPNIVPVVRNLVWAVPLLTLATLLAASLQGDRKIGQSSLVREIGRSVAGLAALAICLVAGLSFKPFLELYIVGLAAVVALGTFLVGRNLVGAVGSARPRYLVAGWFAFALPITILDLFRVSSAWLDTILLGFVAVASDVAVYYAALRTAIVLTIILASFNAILMPMVAELWSRHDRSGLARAYRTTTRWTWLLTLPMAIVLVLCREQFMAFFGPDFSRQGPVVLAIIVLGRLVNAMTGGVGQILLMTGHQRLEIGNTIVAVLATVVGLLLVVSRYGIVGAALLNAVVISSMNIVKVVQVYVLLKIQPYNRSYLKILASAVGAMSMGALVISFAGHLSTWPCMISVVVSVGVTYAAGIATMGLEDEDMLLLENIRSRMGRGPR